MKRRSAPVIVHLSEPGGSSTQPLERNQGRDSAWTIGTAPEAQIRVTGGHGSPAGELHATLYESSGDFTLRARSPHRVWVNGRSGDEHPITSGALIELGADGPLLRFRLKQPDRPPFKTPGEALADCWASASQSAGSAARRIWLFSRGVLREMSTQISPLARGAVLAIFLALVAAVIVLLVRAERLEDRLEAEARNVAGLQELLDHSGQRITETDLEEIRRDLESRIATTAERVDYLEERAGAAERTVAEASRSIVFLQGSYGFRDPGDGLPVRIAVDDEGRPILAPDGGTTFSTAGTGPLVEAFFTGTGFVATSEGLLVTNRHVALPWEFDRDALTVTEQGLEPMMVRMVGYLAGVSEAFGIELAGASDEADLAVLRVSGATDEAVGALGARPLAFAPTTPRVGEAVLVMGFPTGIQAMVARADPHFLEEISGTRLDFWQIAERLALADQIGPLVSRGIIGQVTASAIVYDAETTSGGSGGPVLGLDGRVIAVTSAVLPQFGGSNLGVPAPLALELLELVTGEEGQSPTIDTGAGEGPLGE